MSDTRTTAEKLAAEAETKARVEAEAARAYLAGKLAQWKEDHEGGRSVTDIALSMTSTLANLIRSGQLPLPLSAPTGIVLGGLELLERALRG